SAAPSQSGSIPDWRTSSQGLAAVRDFGLAEDRIGSTARITARVGALPLYPKQQTLSLADCLAKRCRSRPTQPAQATGENKPRRPLLLFSGHPRSRLSWGQGSASHY